MESPHKLAIAEAQVRAGRMSLLTLVRHARAEAPAGDAPLAAPLRPWAALTLACARAIRTVESRRWRCLPTARGAQRAPPVGISQLPGTKTFGGARKPLQTALRAPWRPLRGADKPFRRTGTRLRSFPDSSPPPPSRSRARFPRSPWRRLAHIGTPRSRSAHTTCHPRSSRAKGPRETSHNSESASGGGCGARKLAPSRRLLDAPPAGGASAISRSKRRLHSAGANRFSILGRGAGPRADARKEPT